MVQVLEGPVDNPFLRSILIEIAQRVHRDIHGSDLVIRVVMCIGLSLANASAAEFLNTEQKLKSSASSTGTCQFRNDTANQNREAFARMAACNHHLTPPSRAAYVRPRLF